MAIDSVSLSVPALPAVLAGPVLRRLNRTSMTVWLALSRPSVVTLHVRPVGKHAAEVTTTGTPAHVGGNLLPAVLSAPGPAGRFVAGTPDEDHASSPAWPAEPAWADLAFGTTWPAFRGLAPTLAVRRAEVRRRGPRIACPILRTDLGLRRPDQARPGNCCPRDGAGARQLPRLGPPTRVA